MVSQRSTKPGINNKNESAKELSSSESQLTRLLDSLLTLSIPALVFIHLLVAPYTKVEESFNIQAAHDLIVYGTPTRDVHARLSSTYDHFTFPGAVPRTFVGAILLAGFAQPLLGIVGFQHTQFVVRALLGMFNAAGLLGFARGLKRAYGAGVARWYLLLQASQFHVIFYASRTLPNMFAFGLTTLAFTSLLPTPANPRLSLPRQRRAIVLLVFAAVIFRSEVALLLITTVLHQLILPTLSLERVFFPFTVAFIMSLAISIPIDTYFWQRFPFIWPELSAFIYNVFHGNASNWGISPWHWYFTSALPRLLLNPLSYMLLIPYAARHPALKSAAQHLIIPPLLFIAIYSLQPHKETRFIFYAVPPLTAAAALAANRLWINHCKSIPSAILSIALLASVAATFVASTGMLAISALNYPGGEAISYLRSAILPNSSHSTGGSKGVVSIHADVLTCMTGLTLFTSATAHTLSQHRQHLSLSHESPTRKVKTISSTPNSKSDSNLPRLLVDKTESESDLSRPEFWRQFDYVLTSTPQLLQQRLFLQPPDPRKGDTTRWEAVAVVKGFAGVEIVRPGRGDPLPDEREGVKVVGRGAMVEGLKRQVMKITGGWWVGPRMRERVWILRRVRGGWEGERREARFV